MDWVTMDTTTFNNLMQLLDYKVELLEMYNDSKEDKEILKFLNSKIDNLKNKLLIK